MLKYSDAWAFNDLARLLVAACRTAVGKLLQDASDSAVLAAAARHIDHYLVADPKEFGEARYDTVRVAFVLPLGVQYECLDDVRTVIVYDVWRVVRPT